MPKIRHDDGNNRDADMCGKEDIAMQVWKLIAEIFFRLDVALLEFLFYCIIFRIIYEIKHR